ncbi:MAG: alpha/beta hydrolase, partial [Planctomycetaceae bacterium]|nr:alpha/beta hydrolase [Planctomycetaceae bacterium]
LADLDTYDASPRAIVDAASCVVVSCDYRQAPEHKFPASHEDAWAAYTWVVKNCASLKGDASRIAVAGESAGGNLAAAVAVMARDGGQTLPLHQVLIYPVTSADMNTPSYEENAQAKPLNRAMMKWFFDKELRGPEDAADWKISLLKVPNLKGLPPATVITAQIDPLRSEGKAYADKLKEAGVPVTYRNFDGVTHEFFGMGAVLPEAKAAQALVGTELKKAFSQGKKDNY